MFPPASGQSAVSIMPDDGNQEILVVMSCYADQ